VKMDRRFSARAVRRFCCGLLGLALCLQQAGAEAQTKPSPTKPANIAIVDGAKPAAAGDQVDEKPTAAPAPEASAGDFAVELKRFEEMSSALQAVCREQSASDVARDIAQLPGAVEAAKANAEANQQSSAKNKAKIAQEAAAKARKKADEAKAKADAADKERATGAAAAARADEATKISVDEEANATRAERAATAAQAAVKPETPEAVGTLAQSQLAKNVCAKFCPTVGLSFCGLEEAVLASMLLASPEEVTLLQAALRSALPSETSKRSQESTRRPIERLRDALPNGVQNTSGGADLPVLAATLFQGLGKLIVDRGKAEAVGWVLDRMGKDLCGLDESRTPEQWEISQHWLPNVCALALEKRLSSYGGGGAMLANLKRAVELDLRRWPGTLPGFVPATLYLEDVTRGKPAGSQPDSVIACSTPKHAGSGVCKSVLALRAATRDRINEILAGRNALDALHDLSQELQEANQPNPVPSPRIRSMACGLGLPREFQAHSATVESTLKPTPRAHAAALASAITVPACFQQVKPSKLAFPTWEKLSTILELENSVGKEAAALGTKASAFATALKELRDAKRALDAQLSEADDGEGKPPEIDEDTDPSAVFNATLAFKSGLLEGKLGPARARLAQAALAAADAALVLSQGSLRTIAGACVVAGAACRTEMTAAATQLQEIRNWLAVASEATSGDLGKASIALLAAVRGTGTGATASKTRARLLAHIGVLAAIATAQDSDGIARALDQAATPVGGWRSKGVKGTTTISLTAHPGLFGGAELRNGTYGADDENWKSHGQAPTLALPVGIELAWGGCDDAECPSPVGVYFPVLDPIAFLQYDAEKDGRLPGASLKTVLSPGVGLRLGIPETPFSFIPMVVYRPGFRQWKADWNGTGADALQLGVLLSVDVTLLELSHTEKK
jgi:hypothetical protein